MTEELPVAASNPMEMVVTTNAAPVEQKSPEMVTTEPKTILEPETMVEEASAPIEPTPESVPNPEDKANDVARKAIEAEVRANEAERQLKELQPKPKPLGTRPKIEDYDTLENFETALIEHAREEGRQESNQANSAAEQQRKQLAIRAAIATKGAESRAKHPDFDAVVKPLAGVMDSIPVLRDFVGKNPMGTEVAYELGRNPAVLEQLMRSDHWEASEQLINMAARLKKPAAVQISNAPEPIKPVGSREVVRPKLAELATKDINGYMAKMNKLELAKKRAN